MKNLAKLFIFFLLFNITGCANYINKVHSQLDREEGQIAERSRSNRRDVFDQFRPETRNRESYTPQGRMNRPSTNTRSNLRPSVQRQYRPQQDSRKRYKADDLVDNSSEASLWAGSGKDNYLFTQNKKKRSGDIILLNIMGKMKNEITLELKRAFPTIKKKKPAANAAAGGAPPAAPPAAGGEQAAGEDGNADESKVYDRVSSVVIEEINDDHLLIRGQKFLLYKNRKRLVEIQALVSRRDITDDDTVNSDRVLESSIYVVR